ncbi:MAG: FAD-binding oxidoreductase [Bauldia sp.]
MSDANAAPERLEWQEAAVESVAEQTPEVKSFFLKPPQWRGFTAGQHVDVRLTAPDGYQAERSYSIGSAPEADAVELVIEKLENGEVSPFFHEVVAAGDTIEMRGPIGGHFTWGPRDGGPLLLLGGGSGVVPLMSMIRHRRAVGRDVRTILVYSCRRWSEVIFRDELIAEAASDPNLSLVLTITREAAPMAGVRMGRVDMKLMDEVLEMFGPAVMPKRTFICGSSAFVDVASRLLLEAGIPFGSIKTERYGGDPARAEGIAPVPES